MLNHPTLEKLREMHFDGMVRGYEEQQAMPDVGALSFDERFGLLVDREATYRSDLAIKRRLARARLRLPATVADVDFRLPRGLDKALYLSLANCGWLRTHDNCLINGPTGSGKSYLACALADSGCRQGFDSAYRRLPRLFQELAVARCEGRYPKVLQLLAKTDLLVLDDWGLTPLADEQRRDLLELLEDRYNLRSTIVVSQLDPSLWHDYIGDPTLADAILDRLVHNAHRIKLKGESIRKTNSKLTTKGTKE
jgi:DNA replication protein DnaC